MDEINELLAVVGYRTVTNPDRSGRCRSTDRFDFDNDYDDEIVNRTSTFGEIKWNEDLLGGLIWGFAKAQYNEMGLDESNWSRTGNRILDRDLRSLSIQSRTYEGRPYPYPVGLIQ